MGRWEPDARLRLVRAAIDLCAEQGYDATTVTQIAERAGLTRATFFRYFPDKREVLFAGQDEHGALLAAGIGAASADASPLDAVAAGLGELAASFTDEQREWGPRLRGVVEANAELRERDALKNSGYAEAVTAALIARGVPEQLARVSGELGVLALRSGYTRWSAGDGSSDVDLATHVRAALDDVRAATAELS